MVMVVIKERFFDVKVEDILVRLVFKVVWVKFKKIINNYILKNYLIQITFLIASVLTDLFSFKSGLVCFIYNDAKKKSAKISEKWFFFIKI